MSMHVDDHKTNPNMCPPPNLSSKEGPDVVKDAIVQPFDFERCDWQVLLKMGIQNHCMEKTRVPPTAGKVLAHCKSKVTSFRASKNIRLCVFKLGVTAQPVTRFELYKNQNFSSMWILASSSSVDHIHMLEAALISEFHKHVGCRNREGSGGEGALNRTPRPPPPFCLYIVGARADQAKSIG